MYDYLIVGAGLYGATVARELTDAGKSVLVLDKRPHIAGNVYTKPIEGINVHIYGAHSIPIIRPYGLMSNDSQSLIVSRTLLWLTIKERSTPYRSICTPSIRCGISPPLQKRRRS